MLFNISLLNQNKRKMKTQTQIQIENSKNSKFSKNEILNLLKDQETELNQMSALYLDQKINSFFENLSDLICERVEEVIEKHDYEDHMRYDVIRDNRIISEFDYNELIQEVCSKIGSVITSKLKSNQ